MGCDDRALATKDGVSVRIARIEDLSHIVEIERESFPGYDHAFNYGILELWHAHNPEIFMVLENGNGPILGYCAIVPVTERLFREIVNGRVSSLSSFPRVDVLRQWRKSQYIHFEVIALRSDREFSTAIGAFYLRFAKSWAEDRAPFITASPITPVGVKLCQAYGFRKIAEERIHSHTYPIYLSSPQERA